MLEIYNSLIEMIKDAETVSKAFKLPPISIYFLGGSGCILGKYISRATMDFDFVEQNYPSVYGKVFSMFKDFDMLEYESSILSPKYRERAIKLPEFEYLDIYVLSKEDIIVSKIIRLSNKDMEDIDLLIQSSDKALINKIIDEVLERTDLYQLKKDGFISKLTQFKELYNV